MTHDGKEYRFCCASCRWAFEKNPKQFIQEL
ncbi:MAG: YHS domain-containing protein [Nitrosopumilus sp.]